MANNRVCITCGKAYEYCGYCPTSKNLPMWMNLFDTENCKNIFETASDYAQSAISKEKAISKLSLCDLKNISSYRDNIKDIVSQIIDTSSKEIAKDKIKEQPVKIVPKSKVNKNSVD